MADPGSTNRSHGPAFYIVGERVFTHEGPLDLRLVHDFDPKSGVLAVSASDEGGDGIEIALYQPNYEPLVAPLPPEPALAGALDALGDAMTGGEVGEQALPAGAAPVGYTYFGQFIAHDLTFMRRGDDDEAMNARTPGLDLDGMFDDIGPQGWNAEGASDVMQTVNGSGLFPLGRTSRRSDLFPAYHEDLPRKRRSPPVACIADRRNDDVLPTAQMHVAVLKFINVLHGVTNDAHRTQDLAVRCYQSAVLHDYLRHIVPPDLHDAIIGDGDRIWVRPTAGEAVSDGAFRIPIEFAMAFRFGHSMVRDRYPVWGEVLEDVGAEDFWRSTANHNEQLNTSLVSGIQWFWINNWYQLLDFAGTKFGSAQRVAGIVPMRAAAIDTRISPDLSNLPETMRDPRSLHATANLPPSLARRTLMMHQGLNVADAWTIIDALGPRLPNGKASLAPLSQDDLRNDPVIAALEPAHRDAIAMRPPLWLYVLLEAAVQEGGTRLGQLGGRLVAETLHAAAEAADHSVVLNPDLDRYADGVMHGIDLGLDAQSQFSLPRLIAAAGDPRPVKPFQDN